MALTFTVMGTHSVKSSGVSTEQFTLSLAGASVGDLVVVVPAGNFSWALSGAPVIDAAGNTYQFYAGGAIQAIVYSVVTVALTTSHTISLRMAASGFTNAVAVIRIQGLTSPVEDGGYNTNFGTVSPGSCGALTPSTAITAMIGEVSSNGPSGDTFTATTGTLTGRTGTTGGSQTSNYTTNPLVLETSSVSSQNLGGTMSVNRSWNAAVVAFKSGPPIVRRYSAQQAVQRAASW